MKTVNKEKKRLTMRTARDFSLDFGFNFYFSGLVRGWSKAYKLNRTIRCITTYLISVKSAWRIKIKRHTQSVLDPRSIETNI